MEGKNVRIEYGLWELFDSRRRIRSEVAYVK